MPVRVLISLIAIGATGVLSAAENPRIAERYKQMLAANPVEGTALDRLWKIHEDEGTSGALIAEYRAVAEEDFASALILGHLLRKNREATEARVIYARAAVLDAGSPLPHLALAQLHGSAGDWADAAPEFELAVSKMKPGDPRLVDTFFQLGDAWLAAADTARAVAAWEQTVALDPANLLLRRKLADAYTKNALPGKAASHYRYLATHAPAPERALALQSLARLHQAAAEYDAAIAVLEEGLTLAAAGNWLRTELQNQLIRLYQRTGRISELEQRWKKRVRENPRDLGGYLQLVDLYEQVGNPSELRAWLEKLVALAPRQREYRVRLAKIALQLNDIERVVQLTDQLLEEQPANLDWIFLRADLDVQRNQIALAERRIEKLLEGKTPDESAERRAIEFLTRHRLWAALEQHLRKRAGADPDERSIMALANFHFSQRDRERGHATLCLLLDERADAERNAAAHRKIATVLQEHGDLSGALEALQTAAALQPQTVEYRLALGDLLLRMERIEDARQEFGRAFELGQDPDQQLIADQRLFETFGIRTAENKSRATISGPGLRGNSLVAPLPTPVRPGLAENAALQQHLMDLTKTASEHPSEAAYLRVARWHSWARRNREALFYARKAIDLNGASVAARELVIKAATAEGQRAAALVAIEELAQLQPEKRDRHTRLAGQLEMQAGNLDRALEIFERLEKSAGNDVAALTDLALAQQQAGRWDDALRTWQKAFAVAPVSGRREIIQPLVRALARLGQNEKAAEMLLQFVDGQADESSRHAAFEDLLAHCLKDRLLPWLQAQFEIRHKAAPDDFFTTTALAKILKKEGATAEAFRLLTDASYLHPSARATLPDLIREAEEQKNFAGAIEHQLRLLNLTPDAEAAEHEKLAALQESNWEFEAAHQTWASIAARFGRDPSVLGRAAEHFRDWGEGAKARALFQKIVELEPGHLRAQLASAELAIESAEPAAALSGFEQILKTTVQEENPASWRFPGIKQEEGGKLQQSYLAAVTRRKGRPNYQTNKAVRSFWSEDQTTPDSEQGFRLRAIRNISTLLKEQGNPTALRRWLERWHDNTAAGSGTEALWAFYYSGDGVQAVRQLKAMMAGAPDDAQVKQAFIWVALQTGQFSELRPWVLDPLRSASERDLVLVSLEQLLDQNDENLDARLLDEVFAEPFPLRQMLWQAANLFAAHSRLREACRLGERVFGRLATHRPEYGVELAGWYIHLGEVEEARRVLRQSVQGAGDSFDARIYHALRLLYELLPEAERPAFVAGHQRAARSSKHPVHAAISMTILHGLAGEEREAQARLAQLLALRALDSNSEESFGEAPAYRSWKWILTAGLQLQMWHLDKLAVFLWERALGDEALIHLQGDQAGEVAREIRMRLFARKLTESSAPEATMLLDDFVRSNSIESISTLGSILTNEGHARESVLVHRYLWGRDVRNQHFLRGFLNACRAANDLDSATDALLDLLGTGMPGPGDAAWQTLVLQCVDLLGEKGEFEVQERVARDALQLRPDVPELLFAFGKAQQSRGNWSGAEQVYRRLCVLDPAHSAAQVALATTLEAKGEPATAAELLAASRGAAGSVAQIEAKLAAIYLQLGHVEKAVPVISSLLRGTELEKVQPLAAELSARGRRKEAVSVLREARTRSKDTPTQYAWQLELVKLLQPGDHAGLRRKEMRRLAALEQLLPTEEPREQRVHLAQKLDLVDEVAQALTVEWSDGAGPLNSGAQLLKLYLETGRENDFERGLRAYVSQRRFNAPVFHDLFQRLMASGRLASALKVSKVLCKRDAVNEDRFIEQTRVLHRLGKDDRAWETVGRIAPRQVLEEGVAGKLARVSLELGDRSQARRWFEKAIRNDPAAVRYDVFLDFERFLREEREFTGARHVLQRAFRNPANHEVSHLVKAYGEPGTLPKLYLDLESFRLTRAKLTHLSLSMFEHLVTVGDGVNASRWLDGHAETLLRASSAREQMRTLANMTGKFAAVVVLFEHAIAEQSPPEQPLKSELGLLYLDWAESDEASGNTVQLLSHLRRGHELRPDDWLLAQRLARACLNHNLRPEAEKVLLNLISTSKVEADRERALRLLERIRSGEALVYLFTPRWPYAMSAACVPGYFSL